MQEFTEESQSQLAGIESFILQNDDLRQLEEQVGRFNVFDALGIAHAEIRHSNFLAWLLDPNESHGQGALFFKTVVMDLLQRTPSNQRPLNPIELDGIEPTGVEIRREWKNIDLLIICESPRFVIAIENKTKSGEHDDQLRRYKNTVDAEFANWKSMFVFLTPDETPPSDEEWVPYSYRCLHQSLSRCRKANQNIIGGDVLLFIDHYLNIIGTRFMDDPKIIELCKRIYKNHRAAIELINQHGEASAFAESVKDVLAEGNNEVLYSNRWVVWFLPPSLRKVIPENGTGWTHLSRKVSVAFWVVCKNESSLRIIFELCQMPDIELRLKLVNTLKEAGFKLGKKAFDPGAKYSRFYRHMESADSDDPESIRAAVRECMKHVDQQLPKIHEVCQKVFGDQS